MSQEEVLPSPVRVFVVPMLDDVLGISILDGTDGDASLVDIFQNQVGVVGLVGYVSRTQKEKLLWVAFRVSPSRKVLRVDTGRDAQTIIRLLLEGVVDEFHHL